MALSAVSILRRLVIALCIGGLSACGGGGDALTPLDGTWNAQQTVAGATLSLVLKEQQGTQLVGVGTYRVGSGPPGAIAVAGARAGQAVTLELAYDNGTQATYAGLLTETNRLSGALAQKGGATVSVDFVRP